MAQKSGSPLQGAARGLSSNARFGIVIGIALLVALGLAALIRLDSSIERLTPDEVLPDQVYAYQYADVESFDEKRDELVMGLNPLEASLTRDEEDVLTFRYTFVGGVIGDTTGKKYTSGSIDSRATITLYSVSGDQIEYHIAPAKGAKNASKWSATLRVPRNVDPEHPAGTWTLYVASKGRKWEHCTWVQANPDGTGVFGSFDKYPDNATSREIADASRPCTIEVEPSAAGDRLHVRYEGGELLLVI